ncbi:hypothetical protein C8R44DRAFT_234856 [Mycena epipterygia]|nr:hypothetical protein C8R44DRAFT_234856 [Mycena epipterygia]
MTSTAATRAADRARNADIEAEILHLQRRISILRIEQAPIQQRLDSYTYPVLTLPNEIVSEIFIHVLPVYPLCPPMEGPLSPHALTRICRKWREIALATPALWRAVSICLTMRDEVACERRLHILHSWLNRTSCPIAIEIIASSEPTVRNFISQVFAAIVPHRARWEYLKLETISLSDLRAIEGPMPLLRALQVSLYDSAISPAAVFRQAPRLLAFTEMRGYYNVTYPPDFLPWSQLTSVTLMHVMPDECAPILTQTVNLVHCQLAMDYGDLPIHQSDMELACLESLVLAKCRKRHVPLTHYLNTFIVPALRRLQVPDEFLGRSSVDTLKSFISRSGCQLQEVFITGKRSVPRAVYRHAFPSIPNFTFNRKLTHWKYDKESNDEESDDEESDDELEESDEKSNPSS